jgi:competence protein ComEC
MRREAAREAMPALPASPRACEAGMQWEADGVLFGFVSPPARTKSGKADKGEADKFSKADKAERDDDNARSCVLVVKGRHHSLLLTGDAGAAQEARYAPMLPAVDVVAAPHHGSASSSSAALTRTVGAAQVIAQAGYLNQFHHPARAAVARWRAAGAALWRTDLQGAVFARSDAQGLRVWAQRETEPRYWHDPGIAFPAGQKP